MHERKSPSAVHLIIFLFRGKVVVPQGFEHVNSKSQHHQGLETKRALQNFTFPKLTFSIILALN